MAGIGAASVALDGRDERVKDFVLVQGVVMAEDTPDDEKTESRPDAYRGVRAVRYLVSGTRGCCCDGKLNVGSLFDGWLVNWEFS